MESCSESAATQDPILPLLTMDHMDMEQTQTQMQEAPDSSSQYDDIAHTFTMGGDYVQPHLTNRYGIAPGIFYRRRPFF